jgi:hypothetical protein
VVIGTSTWTLMGAIDRGSTMRATEGSSVAKSSGCFVEIQFRAKNNGKTEPPSAKAMFLLDGEGRRFNEYRDEGDYLPAGADIIKVERLQPESERVFVALFELPADAKDLRLRVREIGHEAGPQNEIAVEPVSAAAPPARPAGAAPERSAPADLPTVIPDCTKTCPRFDKKMAECANVYVRPLPATMRKQAADNIRNSDPAECLKQCRKWPLAEFEKAERCIATKTCEAFSECMKQ